MKSTPIEEAVQRTAGIDLDSLLGRYWEIAYSEGKTGESRGSEAQEVLSSIRDLARRSQQSNADDGISPTYRWLERAAQAGIPEVRESALNMMAYWQGAEFPPASVAGAGSEQVAVTQGPMNGEQVFEFAAPYFAWNASSWHKATQGTIGMPALLSYTRAIVDASIARIAAPTSPSAGELAPAANAGGLPVDGVHWDLFPGHLIDHCEGDIISEEGLQHRLSDMLMSANYKRIAAERADKAPATSAGELTDDLHIGVSNNDQGVHINIIQRHADGTTTVIYAAKAPAGDSYGRAALAQQAGVPAPAQPDQLRETVRAITTLIANREWADVLDMDPDAVALWDAVNGRVDEHNAALAPAGADNVRDAARLDWLDEVNRKTNTHYGTQYGWKFDINHNRAALMDHNWPPHTVREAIDAAMAATQPKGDA